MALAANALTNLATVQDELGLSPDGGAQDARLERFIDAASAAMANYCGRLFQRADNIVEKRAGYGHPLLVLDRWPIVSVASVEVSGATLTSTDYELRDMGPGVPGALWRNGGWRWSAEVLPGPTYPRVPGTEEHTITVTYNGGYVTPRQVDAGEFATRTLPADLEDACVLLVTSRWQSRGQDRRVRSAQYETSGFTYSGGALPVEIRGMLDRYARVSHT